MWAGKAQTVPVSSSCHLSREVAVLYIDKRSLVDCERIDFQKRVSTCPLFEEGVGCGEGAKDGLPLYQRQSSAALATDSAHITKGVSSVTGSDLVMSREMPSSSHPFATPRPCNELRLSSTQLPGAFTALDTPTTSFTLLNRH